MYARPWRDRVYRIKTHPLTIAQVWTPSFPVEFPLVILDKPMPLCAMVLCSNLINQSLPEGSLVLIRLGRRFCLVLCPGLGGRVGLSGGVWLGDMDTQRYVRRRARDVRVVEATFVCAAKELSTNLVSSGHDKGARW